MKEPERPPASREPKLPMRPQPLGLRCPKQPPRRRGGDRCAPGGFGSPEGAPIALPLAGSPCGAPAAAGLPCGPPEDVPPGAGPASSLRRRPGPEGSVSGLSAFVGSPGFRVWPCGLRRFPRFGSPPCGGSANLARSPRVECFDCLERGELYGPRKRRSTPRFRRSERECAGSGLAKKSDNSPRTVTPVTADGEPAGQRASSPSSPVPGRPRRRAPRRRPRPSGRWWHPT